MINLTRASIAGRKRTVAPPPPPPPPPGRFDITTLFGVGDDGIFLAPSHLASLRKRINGEETASASDDLVGVAINLQNRLALGPELIPDPALATSSGWSGSTGSAGSWQHAVGSWSITAATAAGTSLKQDSRGANTGGLHAFELDIVRSAGSFGVRLGSTAIITNAASYNASGNYKWSLVGGTSDDTIRVVAVNAGTTVSFSRISVKRYLGRYGRATSDATRPILKQDGDAWYFSRPGSESLKLWGGALSGCTVCYTTESGVTLLENQTVGADYELLKSARTYGIVVINRTLTTQEKTNLQTEMALLSTSGVNLPDPGSVPAWVSLGSTSNATFRHFVEGPNQYNFRATGANAAVYTFASANVAAQTVTWATQGLTTPVAVEIQGAALVDPLVTHFALGGNGLNGAFPDFSQMTGLSQLYMAKNAKAAVIPSIGALSNLATFWAHDNGATGWGGSAVPASLKDLKLYGNALNQATVDTILAQCNAASLGTGVSIDVGGTNANPSNAGWASRDALVARGATVVVSGTDPRTGTPVGYKWYPGHYSLIANDSELTQQLTEHATGYAIVRGYQRIWYWPVFEAAKDSYVWNTIDSYLSSLQPYSKGLIVQLQVKSFANNQNNFPSYLRTATYGGGIYQDTDNGWNLRLWEPAVVARLIALFEAIAARYDGHPLFYGLVIPESAAKQPVDATLAANWATLSKQYAQAHAQLGVSLKSIFAKTPTAIYFNSGPSAVGYMKTAVDLGSGIGGPDVYIGAYTNNCFLTNGYDVIKQARTRTPVMMSVQQNDYLWTCASSAYKYPNNEIVPPRSLYDFAKSELGSNYLTWQIALDYKDTRIKPAVRSLWTTLQTEFSGDPAGGLPSAFPTLLKE